MNPNGDVMVAADKAFGAILKRGGGELLFSTDDLLDCMIHTTTEARVNAVQHLLNKDGANASMSRYVASRVVHIFEVAGDFSSIRTWLACNVMDDGEVDLLHYLWRAVLKCHLQFSAFCALVFQSACLSPQLKVEFMSLAEGQVFEEGSHE